MEGDIAREVPDLEGVEAAIYLAGIIRERGQTFRAVHVEGVRNLLRAMERAGVGRLLHMSALGARPEAPSRYHRTKAEGEALVRQSGLSHAIFRPSLIFGPGDEFFGRVLRASSAPPPLRPPHRGRGLPLPTRVRGGRGGGLRGGLGAGPRGTYDLVGPKEYSFRELLQLVMEVLGRRKPFLSLPLWLMDRLVPLLSPLPISPLTLDQYLMLKEGNTAPFPEALKELLPAPQALEEVLPRYLRC